MAAELDLFQYVVIRDAAEASNEPDHHIRDVTLNPDGPYGFLVEHDPFLPTRTGIAKAVYDAVFCWATDEPDTRRNRLRLAALDLLSPLVADCPNLPDPPGGPVDPVLMLRALRTAPEMILDDPRGSLDPPTGVRWRLSPVARPNGVPMALLTEIGDAIAEVVRAAPPAPTEPHTEPDRTVVAPEVRQLVDAVRRLLGDIWSTDLATGVNQLVTWRRALLEVLDRAVVLQRWYVIDIQQIVAALKTLAVVELLARDAVVLRAPTLQSDADRDTVAAIAFAAYTDVTRGPVQDWDRKSVPAGFPRIRTATDLSTYLSRLTVVVHPLFVRLFDVLEPLRIRPIGIGQLNVVRDTLLGYEAVEIADVNNVMKGEHRKRTSRKLERSEESLTSDESTFTESSTETARDDRSTLRSAIDTEVNSTLKANVNVNLKLEYGPAVLTTTGGIDNTLENKRKDSSSTEFARTITSKATSRVEQRIATSRSTKLTTETTNTVVFEFDNRPVDGYDPDHVSGIYTWLRKRYRAQVYNRGTRLMYEVVVPEPARQFVELMKAQIEEGVALPRKPDALTPEEVVLGFDPMTLDETLYRRLAAEYDLSALPHPAKTAMVRVGGSAVGGSYAQEITEADGKFKWRSFAATFAHELDGYEIVDITMTGMFEGISAGGPSTPDPDDALNNKLRIRIEGATVIDRNFGKVSGNALDEAVAVQSPVALTGSSGTITIDVYHCRKFALAFWLRLRPTPARIARWQDAVAAAVRAVEQRAVDARNTEERARFLSETRDYRSALDEIEALDLGDFLATVSPGRAELLVREELRRVAVQYLTRAFDGDSGDEFTTDPLDTFTVAMKVSPFVVDRATPSAHFSKDATHDVTLTKLNVAESTHQGRLVQFLEQAFDWRNLSYITYPYYWAYQDRWLDTLSRGAGSDPTFDAFLRAGSVRLLIPATSGYEAASLMYAASGIPWLGREAPTMADPLFRSVADEIRNATEEGGTPVGEPWEYTLPTDLLYLHGSTTSLPSA